MQKNNKNFLLEIIIKTEIQAIIITDGYNIHAVSGYKGHTGCLLFLRDRQYIFTDSRYTEQVTKEAPEYVCVDIGQNGYAKAIAEVIDPYITGCEGTDFRIGFEDTHISYSQYRSFFDTFSDIGGKSVMLVPLEGRIDALRKCKTSDEAEKLAHAERIGDMAFEHVTNMIHAGMTEMEVALELELCMRRNGAFGVSFETIVASGANSSMPHAVPTNRRLTEGDFVTMDFGCIFEGYCSDMTRTVFIGDTPSEKQRTVYNTVLDAQLAALAMIRPGVCCSDVDACARNIISDAGYGAYFGHGLGHGVGLYIHEEPRFSPKCHDILEPGVVITVEPGIYLPGEFGVRIEDLILVTEDGYRNLAFSPKELCCIS